MATPLETTVAGPAEAHNVAGGAKAQPIPDLIAADKYLTGKTAATKKTRGIRYGKFILPGQTGTSLDGQDA